VSGRLKVLVQVDLEGACTRIGVKGPVDCRNVTALCALARRANSLTPGCEIVLDLSAARPQPEVLEQLRDCAASRRLPETADPAQDECRLRIIAPPLTADRPHRMALAA
jgi:hypothetical protein